jgi:hypothetical protein
MSFCAGTAVVGSVLWVIAAYHKHKEMYESLSPAPFCNADLGFFSTRHAKFIMYALIWSALCVLLEIYDFPPLFEVCSPSSTLM